MSTENTTRADLAVESIRNTLRLLTDAERSEVLRRVFVAGDERSKIDSALAAAGDSVTGAAEILGCSRRTLMVRMRELGYPPRKGGGRRKSLA